MIDYQEFFRYVSQDAIYYVSFDAAMYIDFLVNRLFHYLYEEGVCNCKSDLMRKLRKIKTEHDNQNPPWVYALRDFFDEPWVVRRFPRRTILALIRSHTGPADISERDVDLANDIVSIFLQHMIDDIIERNDLLDGNTLTLQILGVYLFSEGAADDIGFGIEPLGPITNTGRDLIAERGPWAE